MGNDKLHHNLKLRYLKHQCAPSARHMSPEPGALKTCQVYAMKYLICEFRDSLLTLVVALCSGVSVPLAPASRTVRLTNYLYI